MYNEKLKNKGGKIMNNLKTKNNIFDKIYEINGIKIILDEDLASLINIETKVLNQTLKRNKDKFDSNDYFKLTKEEYTKLKSVTFNSNSVTFNSNFATSSSSSKAGRKYTPYALTKKAISVILQLKIGRENKEILHEIYKEMEGSNYEIVDTASPVITEKSVYSMIYEIRGKQVILDSDLALIYQVKNGTKEINQAIKRNPNKFPNDFCFRLTDGELNGLLRSQSVTSKTNGRGGRRYLPFAFTEEGFFQLASVLSSPVADEVSIFVMRAFVAMKNKMIHVIANSENSTNLQIINKLLENDKRLNEHESKIEFIMNKLMNEVKEKNISVFFNGQFFDAYYSINEIFSKAKKEIVIEDPYADLSVLNFASKLNIKIFLITSSKSKLTQNEITIYNNQYHNLEVKYTDNFHDRYFWIDRKILYHCGTSLNHAGNKIFNINIINEQDTYNLLKNNLENILKII